MLKRTLQHLRESKPVMPGRAALLFCPALSRERFDRECKPPSLLARLFGARRRDFIAGQVLLADWTTYRDLVVGPVLDELNAIEQTRAVQVIPDATFAVFRKALSCGAFDVLFIVAHHPDAGEDLHVEFADGAYHIDEVAGALRQLEENQRLDAVFLTCDSSAVQSQLYGQIPGLKSVGFSGWKMPLLEGLYFLRLWAEGFDGRATLAKARQQAIRRLLPPA